MTQLPPSKIVVDTSVMIDIFFAHRPRHGDAQKLGQYFIEQGISIQLPWHAMFEISSATKDEFTHSNAQMANNFTEQTPLPIELIPVDQVFFERYFSDALPYARAGDLIFVALAKGINGMCQ